MQTIASPSLYNAITENNQRKLPPNVDLEVILLEKINLTLKKTTLNFISQRVLSYLPNPNDYNGGEEI